MINYLLYITFVPIYKNYNKNINDPLLEPSCC